MSSNESGITIEEIIIPEAGIEIDIVTIEEPVRPKPHILHTIISWCFYTFIVLMPLLFCTVSSEPLELAKQTLLFSATFVIVSLFSVKTLITKKLSIRYSPLYIGMAAVLLAWIITSLASHYRFMSLVGMGNQEFSSLSTILAFALLGIVAVLHFRTRAIECLWTAFYASSALVSIFGLFQLYGLHLFSSDIAKQNSFNTVGLVSTWGAFVVVSLVLALVHLLKTSAFSKRIWTKIALTAFSVLQLGVLAVIDDWRLWLALVVGLVFALVVLFIKIPKEYRLKGWVSVPFFALALAILFMFISPKLAPIPLEVNPGMATSYSIAWDTLKASPLVGYGPGTFRESYEHFRPASINGVNFMNFWTVRFDQAGSTLATAIAATGIIGILALIFLIGVIKWFIGWRLLKDTFSEKYVYLVGASAALVSMVILRIFLTCNLSLAFAAWMVLIALIILTAHKFTVLSEERSHRFTLVSGLVTVMIIMGSGIGVYFTTIRYQADMAYAQALKLDATLSKTTQDKITAKDVDRLVALLTDASKKNPFNDDYQRTLSQAIVYKLGFLTHQAGSKGMTDADRAPLVQASLAAAQKALTLSKGDVRNTYQLAILYQTLSPFVEDAQKDIVKYFESSIDLEPSNPALQYEFALYYMNLAAAASQQKAAAKSTADQAVAQETEDKNVELARTLLLKAVALKEDYAVAYFQLARLYARDKNIPETLHMLDTTVKYNTALLDLNLADFNLFYTVGLAYIELKDLTKAEQVFTLIQKFNPGNPAALYQLALVKKAQGLPKDAKEILQFLLEKDPTNQTYLKAMKDLDAPAIPPASDSAVPPSN